MLAVGVLGCWVFRVLAEIPHFPISPFPQRLAAIISEYPQIL
ncbi:hypothetical protein O53_1070 [Microcystis aeruginosa TAIHU98]|uniref:Uncharacterized protein n=1 Tax=Microcystis aeruginosa TAIHU98 TaxID=1134457 RepID=L7EBR8_MICAE|nr:hypothetical protein O53_1070 [Microcystis aeruginosa TAIHU98]ODV37281.1 hypothetical protein BFG60_3181 [Microcystis aeruginosa NIES-98]